MCVIEALRSNYHKGLSKEIEISHNQAVQSSRVSPKSKYSGKMETKSMLKFDKYNNSFCQFLIEVERIHLLLKHGLSASKVLSIVISILKSLRLSSIQKSPW